MASNHRKPPRLSKEGRRILGGVALLAVFGPLTGITLQLAIADARKCDRTVEVAVAAAPEVADSVTRHATQWSESTPRVGGSCVTVTVAAVDSATMATTPGDADVWIPESGAWLVAADVTGQPGVWDAASAISVATSTIGVAAPTDSQLGDSVSLDATPIQTADPRTDAASLVVLVAARTGTPVDTTGGGDAPRPMSQAGVAAHNTANPDQPLRFAAAAPHLATFDFPYAARADLDDLTARGAALFQSSLNSGTEHLDDGLLAGNGQVVLPPDQAVTAVLDDY